MSRRERRALEEERYRVWRGAYRPYDILKEAVLALAGVAALVVLLAVLFSSPDEPPSTIKQWSRAMPVNFLVTALSELDGTSETATYGPPYNHASGSVQHLAFIHLQQWLGVSHPINAAEDFVIAPLRAIPGQPALQAAVTTYQRAPVRVRSRWDSAYAKALAKARASRDGSVSVPPADDGPLPTMMSGLLRFAQSGGLDGALLTSDHFYQTDYTKPLMFMEDGDALSARAAAEHLLGNQWGMMNETGSYPGQVWLWLYTFWYQIKPFSTSPNADIDVMAIMAVLSLALVLIPFLPVIRDIPRRVPVYRLIWRDHYRTPPG
jgi:hypothetical protein